MANDSEAVLTAPSAKSGSILDMLRTYKPDQGRYVRLTAFWGLVLIWLYGCVRLADTISDLRFGWAVALKKPIIDELWLVEWPLTGSGLVATIIFLAGMASFQYALNRPNTADLLIETESELRKVTWPSAKDTSGASAVVLVTVLVMFGLIAIYDIALGRLIQYLIY